MFTAELDKQREDIARAIESTNKLFTYVAGRNNTIDRLLVDIPPLMSYLAGARDRVSDAVIALGRFGKVTGRRCRPPRATCGPTSTCCSVRSSRSAGARRGSPRRDAADRHQLYPLDNILKVIRGDFMNLSLNIDATLSSLDNGLLTGTGVSGMLRALEQPPRSAGR